MNDQFLFLLAGFGLSAIVFIKFAGRGRPYQLLLLMAAFSLGASAQNWSSFLDSSRAINWNSVGFTIPSYSVNCSTQPSLTANSSSAASSNATAIQNALASCDSTHNVVNIPSGTYYVAGITYPSHGNQVLRGAGPTATKLISTGSASCEGYGGGICMIDAGPVYSGSSEVQYGSGSQQCRWTGGLTQGSTTITLSSCGGTPPTNALIILDQIVDQSDNGGVYICNETTPASCNYDGTGGSFGRSTRNQTQTVYVTGVTSLGGGSYTVTISPGIYFTNIQSGRNPGAWWAGGTTRLNGLENLTVDGTNDGNTVNMYDCYQCWVKNVTLLNGGRASVVSMQSASTTVRDSYFYGSQSAASVSYNVESQLSSGGLVENNIMQQNTLPMVMNNGTGWVIGYNFATAEKSFAPPNYVGGLFSSHSAGNEFNLYEGNNVGSFVADNAWGSTAQQTYFRNMLQGWKSGAIGNTVPILHRSYVRAMNVVGNVLGQPSYHTAYQCYATGNTSRSCSAGENASIYSLGQGGIDSCGSGSPQSSPSCDALAYSTLMRWGNYDTVTAGVKWDSTEASPGAVTYVNANFSSSYFGSLAHTLPASLYYSSTPSWWPSGKAWPAIGPDVTSGSVGICTGTYAGAQATSASQCSGGTLTAAWASHATSIPAQDCFLSLGGKPDGSGSAIAFDAAKCYTSSGSSSGTQPGSPTGLTAVVE